MRLAAAVFAIAAMCEAQTAPGTSSLLKLVPASGAPGGTASVVISLDAPPNQAVLALQWELSYPAPRLGTRSEDLLPGLAAKQAGKTMKCVGHSVDAASYRYTCILAGGTKPIADGPVASITFQVRSGAQPGKATVRVSNVVAVTNDGKALKIDPLEADIEIR